MLVVILNSGLRFFVSGNSVDVVEGFSGLCMLHIYDNGNLVCCISALDVKAVKKENENGFEQIFSSYVFND